MFTFDTPTAVKLGHVNLRAEKHGEQSAPAIDVKFVRQAGNDALAMLHPGLKDALYFRDEQTAAQGQKVGVFVRRLGRLELPLRCLRQKVVG